MASAKLVRFVDISKDGDVRIRSQVTKRREQESRRKQFEDHLRDNFDDPDLRLLAGDHDQTSDIMQDVIAPHEQQGLLVRPAVGRDGETPVKQKPDKSWSPEEIRSRCVAARRSSILTASSGRSSAPRSRSAATCSVEHLVDHLGLERQLVGLVNNDDGWLQDERDIA